MKTFRLLALCCLLPSAAAWAQSDCGESAVYEQPTCACTEKVVTTLVVGGQGMSYENVLPGFLCGKSGSQSNYIAYAKVGCNDSSRANYSKINLDGPRTSNSSQITRRASSRKGYDGDELIPWCEEKPAGKVVSR
jgi:hypothetical protein